MRLPLRGIMELTFLKKAKKNEILAMTVVGCLAIAAGYYFLFLSPVFERVLLTSKEVANLQNRIDEAHRSIDAIPRLRDEIRELETKEAYYHTRLSKEEEFTQLLEHLSDIAQHAGVKITKILPLKVPQHTSEDAEANEIYAEKKILINAYCGYHQLGTFVASLESSERFMEIDDILIESRKNNPSLHNVQLVIQTFILKEEQ